MQEKKKKNKTSPEDGENMQDNEHQNFLTAHDLAESDIKNDPDLTAEPKVGDDLDEGELARLEGEE